MWISEKKLKDVNPRMPGANFYEVRWKASLNRLVSVYFSASKLFTVLSCLRIHTYKFGFSMKAALYITIVFF